MKNEECTIFSSPRGDWGRRVIGRRRLRLRSSSEQESTKCGFGPTKGSESPLATEGNQKGAYL